MQSMMEWTDNLHQKIKENIENAQKKQKKQYDAKHQKPAFKITIYIYYTSHE